MILYNPTNLGIRSDSGGDGHFGASRGDKKHKGLDFICAPGQIIKAVIAGKLIRAYPYAGDVIFTGCRIWGKDWMSKMFYFIPHKHLINEDVLAGENIGIAQDISAKYGGGMKPHIHVELYKLNPTKLVDPEEYLERDCEKLKKGGY